MRAKAAAFILGLFISGAALAGGGDFPQEQEQYSVPQTKIVVVPDDNPGRDNTAIWVAVVGAAATLGAAYITVRHNRKH